MPISNRHVTVLDSVFSLSRRPIIVVFLLLVRIITSIIFRSNEI